MARSTRRRATRALSRASVTCAAALSAAAGIGMLGEAPARAEHIDYRINTLGFLDSLHTNQDGKRFSTVFENRTNAIGQVAGTSLRFDDGGLTSTGESAWFFNPANAAPGTLTQVGLLAADGEEYVRESTASLTAAQSSIVTHLNDDSVVGGYSKRYDNDNNGADMGQAAWFYRAGATESTRVGLYDDTGSTGDYTNVGGYQYSEVKAISNTGWVVGNSARYDAAAELPGDSRWGAAAWIHDGTAGSSATTSVRIGLTDAEHTSSDTTPKQTSNAQFVNNAGMAAGTSERYNGEDARGSSAWLWNGSQTVKIGLTDGPEFEKSNTEKVSSVSGMNNNPAVHVMGTSNRYSGANDRGTAAWRHVGTSSGGTTRIGLFGSSEFQDNNLTENSTPLKMNEAGHIVGSSTRYNGTATSLGQALWIYKGGTTNLGTRIGFTGAGFTKVSGDSTNGTQSSTFKFLNEDGDVAGRSQRYNGANPIGNAAWVYNGTATVPVGLTDAEHTLTTANAQNGTQESDIGFLNEAGQAAGTSQQYGGGIGLGTSVWVYDGNSTERTGLTDFDHTSSGGHQVSVLQAFNEEGQAAGYSLRYQGGPTSNDPPFGRSGWFYDDETDTTIPLVFSTSSNSETYTNVAYLSDIGIVLGSYKKYNGATLEGEFAFLWDFRLVDLVGSPNTATMDGFHDLGEMVNGGLDLGDFDYLKNVLDQSELNHILGTGVMTTASTDEYDMPYLLTPVPEPVSVALLAMTGILVLPRRRRR